MVVTELLRDTDRATSTINTCLSVLKGVAKEVWMLKLMDVESFQHIRALCNMRVRAFPLEEVRMLFGVCEDYDSNIGVGDV